MQASPGAKQVPQQVSRSFLPTGCANWPWEALYGVSVEKTWNPNPPCGSRVSITIPFLYLQRQHIKVVTVTLGPRVVLQLRCASVAGREKEWYCSENPILPVALGMCQLKICADRWARHLNVSTCANGQHDAILSFQSARCKLPCCQKSRLGLQETAESRCGTSFP